MGVPVVGVRDASEAFLASSIPNLELDDGVIYADDFVLKSDVKAPE
jgi:hypothetical protein